MNKSFDIGTLNKIGVALVMAVVFGGLLLSPNKSSESIGYAVGMMLALVGLPLLIGWTAWRISGRGDTTGRLAFSVVLILGVMGQVAVLARRGDDQRKQDALFADMQRSQQAIRTQQLNPDDPEAHNAAIEKYQQSMSKNFDALAQTGDPDERKFFEILSAITKEQLAKEQTWQNAYFAVTTEGRVLDYTTLDKAGDFSEQRKLVEEYRKQTDILRQSLDSLEGEVTKRLKAAGLADRIIQSCMEGVRRGRSRQKPIQDPLFRTHLEYAQTMLGLLDALEKKPRKWSWDKKQSQLLVDDDALLERVNGLVEQLEKQETTIADLAQQLVKTM